MKKAVPMCGYGYPFFWLRGGDLYLTIRGGASPPLPPPFAHGWLGGLQGKARQKPLAAEGQEASYRWGKLHCTNCQRLNSPPGAGSKSV